MAVPPLPAVSGWFATTCKFWRITYRHRLQELLEMFLGRFDVTLTAHIRAIVGGGQDDNEEVASSEVDEVDGCDGLSLPFEHPPPSRARLL